MKIKRILILSLTIILAVMCAFAISACDNFAQNDADKQQPEPIDPSVCQHSWTVQETAPTCLNKGYRTTVCELCGKEQNVEEIPALDHDIVEHEGKAATCTEGGWKAYKTCTRCSYTTYQAISALDHTMPTYIPSKPATCTEDGYEAYAGCERCHEIIEGKIAVIPALKHDMKHIDRQDSTCTEVGWEAYEACSRCDYKENYVEIPIHHYENGVCIDCGRAICLDYLEFQLNDAGTEYIVKSYKKGLPAQIIIPATHNGLPITTIEKRAFSKCSTLESVILGENIKNIGDLAFSYCSNLTAVTWNATNCEKTYYAFNGCSNLKTITIGRNVQSMPQQAFMSDINYDGVYISDLEAWCNIEFEEKGNPLDVAKNLYLNGELVEDLVIPDGVTEIKAYVFNNCKSIKTVTISDSVLIIENNAFAACSNITDVTIGNKVQKIGDYAFGFCEHLQNVTIGNSVTSIGYNAFVGCHNLENVYTTDMGAFCSIDFEDGNAQPLSVSGNVSADLYLNGELVEDLVVPEGVTGIGKYAFAYYTKLKSVTLPTTLTKIGRDAFNGCVGLKEVKIAKVATWCDIDFYNELSNPLYYAHDLYLDEELVEDLIISDGVTEIKAYAFYDCDSIKAVTIPEGVTNIGYMAFDKCDNLSSVNIMDVATWCNLEFANEDAKNSLMKFENLYFNGEPIKDLVIPEGVTTIHNNAFKNCSSIKTVTIPSTLTEIGEDAFYECNGLTGVYISDLEAWCNIEFENSDANPLCYAHNLYLDGELVEELVISDGVTEIKAYAFYGCYPLTSTNIPSSVISIGDYAFYDCKNVANMNIPDSVTSLGDYVCASCTKLTDVTIGKGIYAINAGAFYGCTSLTTIVIPSNVKEISPSAFKKCFALLDVTISSGVEIIGERAFESCTSLASITIPDSVEIIGDYAFYECGLLQNIKIYKGLEIIGEYAFAKCECLAKIEIPDSINEIGNRAFEGCSSLMSVKIGYGAQYIGKRAFNKCDNLKYVDFAGPTGWNYSYFGTWGGRDIDVSVTIFAADYLSSTYVDCYFYKVS